MGTLIRSSSTALLILASIQCFTVGLLSPRLSLEICQPGILQSESFDFAGVRELSIKSSDGAILVNTTNLDRIQIKAEVRAFTPDSNLQSVAEEYLTTLFDTTESKDRISINTEPGIRPDGVEVVVDYIVSVPAGTNLKLDGSNGNVSVGPGCGRVTIHGNNTDVLVQSPEGRVHATIANGRIRVDNALEETLLETVNGSIYANIAGGRLSASTANGNIVTQILDSAVTGCELTAMNGGITLMMPEECSAEVNAETSRGVVRSEIPLTDVSAEPKRRTLRGRIGSTGRTRLDLNSLNGNIDITRSEV